LPGFFDLKSPGLFPILGGYPLSLFGRSAAINRVTLKLFSLFKALQDPALIVFC